MNCRLQNADCRLPPRRRCNLINLQSAICNLQFLLAFFLVAPVFAQDDVVHRRAGIKMRGTIVSQDATGVRIIYGSKKEPTFVPAEEIERVEVKLTPDQEEGERLFEQGNYRDAIVRLGTALEAENRAWLRGRLYAKLVAARVAAGDSLGAVDAFLAAVQAPGSQVPWAAIPVWWLPEPPATSLEQHAVTLLRSDNPTARVIGASFLFGSDHSAEARDVLAKLTTFGDERVGQLARTQLWRWEVADASAENVASWQRQVARLPADSRGGPHLVIGLALERLARYDEAALEFLWPALVHRTDPLLSRRALFLAARSLHQSGQRAEAQQLYQELVARFPGSSEAASAQKQLDAVKE